MVAASLERSYTNSRFNVKLNIKKNYYFIIFFIKWLNNIKVFIY